MSRQPTNNRTKESEITWSREHGWEGISNSDYERWSRAFPAVDIQRQLAAMENWLIANPLKAHKKLWRRFIHNWLTRQQERGGDVRSNPVRQPLKGGLPMWKDPYRYDDRTGEWIKQ